MSPAIYNPPPHVKGDTLFWRNPIRYLNNAEPIDISGAVIEMWIRERNAKGIVHLKWSTATGEIFLSDPTEGEFQIQSQTVDIPAGRYYYDIQMTLSGETYTFVAGYLDVIEDSTK